MTELQEKIKHIILEKVKATKIIKIINEIEYTTISDESKFKLNDNHYEIAYDILIGANGQQIDYKEMKCNYEYTIEEFSLYVYENYKTKDVEININDEILKTIKE